MTFFVLTIFPEMFSGPLTESILKRAAAKNLFGVKLINLRDFALDKHKSVDDRPYGGGQGMIIKVEVMDRAIGSIKKSLDKTGSKKTRIILLDPRGQTYNQKKAKQLCRYDNVVLVCGHYEGFDERIRDLVDETVSIGDYILTGGEIPAMAVIDSVARLLPGVLSAKESVQKESFQNSSLEYPQYTRPENFKNKTVPKILLSGNRAKISAWQEEQALKITKKYRPDLERKTKL